MLTSVFRALVKNPVKENFYGKKKKKQLMFWQLFSFPIKVMSKLSLIRFLTSILRALVSISLQRNKFNVKVIIVSIQPWLEFFHVPDKDVQPISRLAR